ncbi:MAG TPA: hypothetical protein VFT21_11125 [Gemmatimonadaceae bacterium]|nr:hypothetical protein [Gemmatimonadaceae bacterium]
MKPETTNRSRLVVAATAVLLTWTAAHAQKTSLAEVAASLSGTWKVNRDLSDPLSDPARGRRGGALFTTAIPVGQRGGGRGGGGADANTNADLTPEELAAQAAIRELQRVAEIITIKATVDSVSFSDTRGERTYPVNGRKIAADIAGAKVNVKSSWDKNALKQEFSTSKATFRETWEVDQNNRLVLKAKLESLTMVSKEVKTVFDKQ